jgi:hypothetical protein
MLMKRRRASAASGKSVYRLLAMHCRRNTRFSSPSSLIACSWHSALTAGREIRRLVERGFRVERATRSAGLDAYQQRRPLMVLYLACTPWTSCRDRQCCSGGARLRTGLGGGRSARREIASGFPGSEPPLICASPAPMNVASSNSAQTSCFRHTRTASLRRVSPAAIGRSNRGFGSH